MLKIRATLAYPSGNSFSWVFDMDNPDDRREFAISAKRALMRGATVTTVKVEKQNGPK